MLLTDPSLNHLLEFQKWLNTLWQFDGSCAFSTVRVENW
jgi:hypothetical protein